jgi:hypothetical protein
MATGESIGGEAEFFNPNSVNLSGFSRVRENQNERNVVVLAANHRTRIKAPFGN